jgi:hypothetical protein
VLEAARERAATLAARAADTESLASPTLQVGGGRVMGRQTEQLTSSAAGCSDQCLSQRQAAIKPDVHAACLALLQYAFASRHLCQTHTRPHIWLASMLLPTT